MIPPTHASHAGRLHLPAKVAVPLGCLVSRGPHLGPPAMPFPAKMRLARTTLSPNQVPFPHLSDMLVALSGHLARLPPRSTIWLGAHPEDSLERDLPPNVNHSADGHLGLRDQIQRARTKLAVLAEGLRAPLAAPVAHIYRGAAITVSIVSLGMRRRFIAGRS